MSGSPPHTQAFHFFYGLQPRWLSSDRLFRIYVSNKMLAGAYIAGQFYDERAATIQLQQAALLLRPLVRHWLARRLEREASYESSDPFSPLLLEQDQRNFQILRSDVVRLRLSRRRSLWTAFNVGRLEIDLLDGSIRRFILVGDQEVEEVISLLKMFDAEVEATGKPNPLKPPTPAQRRQDLLFTAILFLGLGGSLGYLWLDGRANDPRSLPVAVVSLLVSLWCLFQAWKHRQDPPSPGEAD